MINVIYDYAYHFVDRYLIWFNHASFEFIYLNIEQRF